MDRYSQGYPFLSHFVSQYTLYILYMFRTIVPMDRYCYGYPVLSHFLSLDFSTLSPPSCIIGQLKLKLTSVKNCQRVFSYILEQYWKITIIRILKIILLFSESTKNRNSLGFSCSLKPKHFLNSLKHLFDNGTILFGVFFIHIIIKLCLSIQSLNFFVLGFYRIQLLDFYHKIEKGIESLSQTLIF